KKTATWAAGVVVTAALLTGTGPAHADPGDNQVCIAAEQATALVAEASTEGDKPVKLATLGTETRQHWVQQERFETGILYYTFVNVGTGECLASAESDGSTTAVPMTTAPCDSWDTNQQFRVAYRDGEHGLPHAVLETPEFQNIRCVAFQGQEAEAGAPLVQEPCDSQPDQHWHLFPAS
ncbi:RICIN domain-containing protein, partial [Streptomyces sp. AC602_WCS936]|uniref:RICIN domain-containing protein n=1 Tax=Streptomyces sp. AC602_WCS936 TaxID=2823685 RepID=UPI001C254BB7